MAMRKPWRVPGFVRDTDVGALRFEARCAYLDGRVARARELNRRADMIQRAVREREAA